MINDKSVNGYIREYSPTGQGENMKSIVMIIGIVLMMGCALDNPKPDSSIYDFVDNQDLASNLIGSILKTTNPECFNNNFRELLQDCAENPTAPSITCPNGQKSCVFIYEKLGGTNGILNKTLDKWKTKYILQARMEGDPNPLTYSSGLKINFTDEESACLNDDYDQIDKKVFPIPIGTGGSNLNFELSQQRAQSVLNHLASTGIQAERLTAAGLGESQPIADNDTKEGRSLNRRIEFTVRRK